MSLGEPLCIYRGIQLTLSDPLNFIFWINPRNIAFCVIPQIATPTTLPYPPPSLQALVTQSAANLEEVRFEATSVSTRILLEQRSLPQAKSLLRSKLDNSIKYPYWHMRLLLQLADIHVCERDERGVVSVLDRCADYAKQVDASYARWVREEGGEERWGEECEEREKERERESQG